jgi:hypothetical protein
MRAFMTWAGQQAPLHGMEATCCRNRAPFVFDVAVGSAESPVRGKRGSEMRSGGQGPRVSVDDVGFDFFAKDGTVHRVDWSDIDEVVAYKQDLMTTDAVCLEVTPGRRDVVRLDDDVAGFWILVDKLKERLPTSSQDWEKVVVKPAFEANRTVIFQKSPLS